MKWILYSNVGGLYLSWKDSGSNPFGRTQVYIGCVLPKRFEAESFPLKYEHLTFEYKMHSVKVDLYYFKYL